MVERQIDMRPVSPVHNGKKHAGSEVSPRTRASLAAKKEVESNPFKKLIDISDLIEFENCPADVEKEV
jgi:hypothetical protein